MTGVGSFEDAGWCEILISWYGRSGYVAGNRVEGTCPLDILMMMMMGEGRERLDCGEHLTKPSTQR